MSRITPENWNYSHYKSLNLKAFISIAGVPVPESDECKTIYCVSVLENDENEVIQKDFQDLGTACDFINERYSHWDHINLLNTEDKGGCGSCAAH